jgi:energy-coupling factor transporter transmembrane protein EcfT
MRKIALILTVLMAYAGVAVAQGPTRDYLRVINNGTTTLTAGMFVQWDTTQTIVYHDSIAGVKQGNAGFDLPDTATFSMDSTDTFPANTGAGFQLWFKSYGTDSNDSIKVAGVLAKQPWVTVESGVDTSVLIRVDANDKIMNYNELVWVSVDSIMAWTTGLDSVQIMYMPVLGVKEADSNDTDVIGMVLATEDSIQAGARGRIHTWRVQSLINGLVNGNTTAVKPMVPLAYGNSGLVPSATTGYAAADTLENGVAAVPLNTVRWVARSATYVNTTQKSAPVLIWKE